MAITVPTAGSELSVTAFGKPVADGLNAVSLRVGGTWRRANYLAVAPSSWTTIPWDTEITDTHNFLAVGATTLSVPTGQDGIYAITCTAYIGVASATQLMITGNADNVTAVIDPVTGSATAHWTGPLSAAGQVSVRVFQTGGTSINILARLDVWKVAL